MNDRYDVAVIGGGPGGLAAAIEARRNGAKRVLIIERNERPGGILPQCIHNGFGADVFGQDLPGPLYAQRFIEEAEKTGVEFMNDTMVMALKDDLTIYAASHRNGYKEIHAGAVVLAMGCRERTRAQIRLPGTRPAGVFTAGTVQRLVNIEGFMPGRRFVILGSGDIGMIMARRLTIEGAEVVKVVEILPFLTGLRRNYVQCLRDFDIPLELSTTVNRIIGRERLEAVETVQVDSGLKPIPGTETLITCDSLLLSVGLIPENELSLRAGVELDPVTGGPRVDERMATNIPGIFAAGNVVTIYDLADEVSKAGYIAGRSAAEWARGGYAEIGETADILPGENVRSVVPHRINVSNDKELEAVLSFRVSRPIEEKTVIEVMCGDTRIERIRKPFARPAEMLSVRVKIQDIYNKTNRPDEKITVNVRAADGE